MTKSRDLANAATALNAVSATELAFVDGVTSAIQTQIDTKLATATAATTYIAKSLPTAKGDILTATASGTPAVLPVSTQNGDTIVADSAATSGLRYTSNFAAGKNKVINGDFGIWQRGTSFSVGVNTFTSDRWIGYNDGGTCTVSQQTFTAGTAPVAGYEGTYFLRANKTASGGTFIPCYQKIEDVRIFAGQTVTVSFWAKANASDSNGIVLIYQNFGSGGSGSVSHSSSAINLTTSWARYTATIAISSIAGKTIGTGSWLELEILRFADGATRTIDMWGVQIEAGSVATAFQTATGTVQGELAACQRYYVRVGDSLGASNQRLARGVANLTTAIQFTATLPVQLRTGNSATIDFSALQAYDGSATFAVSAVASSSTSTLNPAIVATVSGATIKQFYELLTTSTSGYIAFSAEL